MVAWGGSVLGLGHSEQQRGPVQCTLHLKCKAVHDTHFIAVRCTTPLFRQRNAQHPIVHSVMYNTPWFAVQCNGQLP